MKPFAIVAVLVVQLMFLPACTTVGHDAAGTPATTRDITVTTLENGAVRLVVSADAAFHYGSSVLLSPVATQLSGTVKPYMQQPVKVSGYTDNVGAATYNLTLSRARARSVADALILEGFAATQVTVDGFGEADPVSSNETEAGRRMNRRIELLFESLN